MAKKKKVNKKGSAAKGLTIPKFWKNQTLLTFSGIFLVFLGLFLLLAFISYFSHWKSDQSWVSRPFFDLMKDPEYQVDNLLGKLGAVTAHQFIHRWFGWISILIPAISILLGLRVLLGEKLKLSLIRFTKHSIFYLIWFPVFTALAWNSSPFAGYIGQASKNWLVSAAGPIGSWLIIIFLGLAFLSIVFRISPAMIRGFFQSLKRKAPLPQATTTENDEDFEHGNVEIGAKYPEATTPEDLQFEMGQQQKRQKHDGEDLIEESEKMVERSKETIDTTRTSLKTTEDLVDSQESISENMEDETGVEMEIQETKEEEIVEDNKADRKDFGDYDPTLDLSRYQLPTLELLDDHGSGNIEVNKDELSENKKKIVNTLADYKIEVSKINATVGPTVTLYEIVPAAGVRISKIKNLEDDIALSLAALGIRIIAPIPGKGTIGIEVPRTNPNVVSMKSVLASEKFKKSNMELPVALGKTISNETFVADLAKMPHLLMAGATGQGKSVGLNAILSSILYKKHPSQVKFVLVDPKKVELTLFNHIERHFLAKLPDSEDAIITDTSKVINTLNSLCIEMDQRYDLLKNAMVRNIKEYNAKFIARKLNPNDGHRYLPYIVLVVDEFADLIMTAGKEVETPIARLAQLARAIGIHLIIATQRPSVNVITGIIKANFPARIAFRVTSKIDSRTILDTGGADQLIGRGDMLLSMGSELIRIQCAFIDTPEVEAVCDYIGNQQGYPEALLLPEYVGEDEGSSAGGVDLDERDSKFEDAARVVVIHQQGSASLLQRKLKLGYNRAGRIVDQLEAAGIIGPFEGSKARQVLVPDEMALEQLLTNLNQKNS